MSLFSEVMKRRLIPWMGGYLVTGFVVLEAADQMVSYGMVPETVYRVVFTMYAWGVIVAAILAWYHGERGPQKPERGEVTALTLIITAAVVNAGFVVARHQAPEFEEGLDPRQVAVLYLEDVGDGESQYLADGITEALIDQLSTVGELSVISRNGVDQFRGTTLEYDSIAWALEAGTLVSGSVEEVGGRVQVSVQMLDGMSGASFDRTSIRLPAEDALDLQDSVVVEVSRFLRERLGEEIRTRETRAATESVEAWTSLQRGERAMKNAAALLASDDVQGAWDAYGQADEFGAQAAVEDPQWADPWVLRSQAAYRKARLLAGEPVEAWEVIQQGISHADQALALAPNDPPALEVRGTLSYLAWLLRLEDDDPAALDARFVSAKADLEGSVDRDSGLASAHSTLSHLLYQEADIAGAVLEARAAYEEDAYLDVADVILARLFNGSYDLGQFDDAQDWCDEGRRRFPDNYRFVDCKLWLMLRPGEPNTPEDVQTAWALRDTLLSLTPESIYDYQAELSTIFVAGVANNASLADSANTLLTLINTGPDVDPEGELPGYMAAVLSITGDSDAAMDLLKVYVAANRDHRFTVGGNLHWWWRGVSAHPEFRAVVLNR
jgi:serine/threonine-protein kinase